jgi:hypothetical protein
MNSAEREQLTQFLQQLVQAQAGPKDVEAQSLIARALAQQPDAAYLLVQRALLQDAGLQVAQDRITALQDEVARLKQPGTPAGAAGGFLDANAWGRAPVAPSVAPALQAGMIGSQLSAQQPAAPANYQAPPPAASGFQAPSFLTSMASTAAGVAAGAFLFQGLGHLMGGHQNTGASAFGLSGPQAGNNLDTAASPPGEVINNYFDAPQASSTGFDRESDRLLEPSASASADEFDSAGLDLDSTDDWT